MRNKIRLSATATAGVFVSMLGIAMLVYSTVLAVDLPDLTIDSIVVTPTSPQMNQSVSIVVTGKNAGVLSLTDITGLNSYSRFFDNFTSSTTTEPTVSPVPTTSDPLATNELFTYTWTGMFTATGTKNLSFTIDNANNLTESDETNNTATSTVVVVAPPDTTAPVITGPTVTNLTATSTTINWTTNEASDSMVKYGLTTAYGSTVSTSTLVMIHYLNLTGLTSSTTYHFMVSSTDAAGNTATSSDNTFKTLSLTTGSGNTEIVTVCHYNGGSKKYSLITISRAGWENGHKKHEHDFITGTSSCANASDDDDDDEDEDEEEETSGFSNGSAIEKLRNRIRELQYRISQLEKDVVQRERQLVKRINTALINRLRGHILLQVEDKGQAWYVDADSNERYYLADGRSAYQALQAFGLGISDADLEKIPVGLNDQFVFTDTDSDGLPDQLEASLGTDPNDQDSDNDGLSDKQELLNGYDPRGSRRFAISTALVDRLKGKILLQVQKHGEAWWINPEDGMRYYLKDGDAAYNIMRFLSLGIKNTDLQQIGVGSLEAGQ